MTTTTAPAVTHGALRTTVRASDRSEEDRRADFRVVAKAVRDAGLLEQLEVFRHPESRHLRAFGHDLFQLAEGASTLGEQRIEKQPPRRVGQRLEHQVVIHTSDNR